MGAERALLPAPQDWQDIESKQTKGKDWLEYLEQAGCLPQRFCKVSKVASKKLPAVIQGSLIKKYMPTKTGAFVFPDFQNRRIRIYYPTESSPRLSASFFNRQVRRIHSLCACTQVGMVDPQR